MSFSKYILPVLVVAGGALAQSSSACSGALTIASTADAAQIQGCDTFDGSITIDPTASGQIAINGVQSITGDLICKGATQLTALTSDQLGSISGTFSLTGLTILSTLQFSSLNAVNHINWVTLPALQTLNFNQGITQANTVYISDTYLTSLSGIELTAIGSMDVNNNKYLTTINVNNLKNVTTLLKFAANGRDLQISFPNLERAANLTFRDVNQVDMPSLNLVDGAMGFYSDLFESFSAPNLTATGSSLAFSDCQNLNNLSFPSLTTIGGGFIVTNNPNLAAIDDFPKLQTVGGAIDFEGTFSKITLGSIKDVRGGSIVVTTAKNSPICDQISAAHNNGIIKGNNNCTTGTSSSSGGSSGTGSSGSSSSSSGAANPAVFNPSAPLTGLSAIIAAMLFL